MLPERFGKANSVRRRFRRLAQKGVWSAVFAAVAEPDLDWVMLDSTVVRAHQHAAGQKKTTRRAQPLAVAAADGVRKFTPAPTRWVMASGYC